jgi:hypothetical protein
MRKDKELKKQFKNVEAESKEAEVLAQDSETKTESSKNVKTETEKPGTLKQKTETEEEERDPYEGYSRDDPPPWMDEFEYIDFMMTH